MKRLLVRILDSLIPLDLKEFEQNEELARARALVLVLLTGVIASILGLIGDITINLPPALANSQTRVGLIICIVSYTFAIWIFRRTGLYVISGNIFALTQYITILTCVLTLQGQESIFFLLILLALPMLVTLIANYISGLVWLLIVIATPTIIGSFWKIEIWSLFLSNWIFSCISMFLAIYIGHYYRESMARRLNTERTTFEFAAAHDSLTGLANRATFDRRLREAIEACTLHDTKAVLIYIDLDRFKPINDTFGHQAGDIVLTTVANRLRRLVRRFDTVARLGGDEFAILFEKCSSGDPLASDELRPLIERLAVVINEPIEVFDNRLVVDCSIGVVVCPDDGLHPEQLSHKADERMYAAKRKAREERIIAS